MKSPPAPHNVQLWRVKTIGDRQAQLYIDSRRTLPKEDLRGSFIILTNGRGDLTAAFYGVKVYPTDIEEIVSTHEQLTGRINSFQIVSREDANLNKTLQIHLEKTKNFAGELPASETLR